MEPDPLDPTDSELEAVPPVLEPPELPLDGGAATVERLTALRLAQADSRASISASLSSAPRSAR